jgi:hypothetical protein
MERKRTLGIFLLSFMMLHAMRFGVEFLCLWVGCDAPGLHAMINNGGALLIFYWRPLNHGIGLLIFTSELG